MTHAGTMQAHRTRSVSYNRQDTAARAMSYQALNVEIAHTLATNVDVHRAIECVLELMGTSLGWQFGIFWQPDPEERVLTCAATWSDPSLDLTEFEAHTRGRVFALGEGMLGKAWESSQPRWIADIGAEPGFLRPEVTGRAGLRAAVLVPIPTGPQRHRHAVIEFLSSEVAPVDDGLVTMLETMSAYVDQYIQLRVAERELRRFVSSTAIDAEDAGALAAARASVGRSDDSHVELLAMASHELRTPLTSIAGFTSTMIELGDELDGDQKRRFLEIINGQTVRLQRLVDDLHLYARVDSGHLPVDVTVIDVGAAIGQAIRELDVEDIAVTCPPDLLACADRDHLQQMLANYLSNALKYGEAPISVEAGRTDGSIVIVVTDRGQGVADDFVPRLFERFERGAVGPDIAGTGLGLSIVRGLARAQDGDAWYEPNEPRGSRFCLRLRSSVGD